MSKEKISITEFLEDIKKVDADFKELCEEESEKYAVSSHLLDKFSFKYNNHRDWQQNELFPYKLIDIVEEKGDGHDESTRMGIFERKSDGKYFKLWVHDAGLIGPGTLTLCEYLEEVTSSKKEITEWN